jgi:hypothetical protein
MGMRGIIKNIIESELGRPLTIEEENIVDEHTELVTEIYKLDKRRRELVQKIANMKDASKRLQY